MKTDIIFYEIFQEFPSIFFELIGKLETNPNVYEFHVSLGLGIVKLIVETQSNAANDARNLIEKAPSRVNGYESSSKGS